MERRICRGNLDAGVREERRKERDTGGGEGDLSISRFGWEEEMEHDFHDTFFFRLIAVSLS